ncbi:MAG: hypothetical protein KC561_10010, partial [Myxococcales bacterium]|nr:hypothetical protein [Myxococcales bacterium]
PGRGENREPIMCSSSRWLYTDYGGLLKVKPDLLEEVRVGDVIARQTDIFGQQVKEYVSPESGFVIGKSVNPVSPSGARIVHLGTPAEQDSPILSWQVAKAEA